MANIYVRSTDGNDADNGSTWALAKATVAGAAAIDAAGDSIYLSQAHAESTTANQDWNFAGTSANPVKIIAGNDGASPPTTLATASITIDGGTYTITTKGAAYFYGLDFHIGTSTNRANAVLAGTSDSTQVFDTCGFYVGTSDSYAGVYIGVSGNAFSNVEWLNCHYEGASSNLRLPVNGRFTWNGGTVGTTGHHLFSHVGTGDNAATSFNPTSLVVNGVDLSGVNSAKSLINNICEGVLARFTDCKLPSSWTGSPCAGTMHCGSRVEVINCDSADTHYNLWIKDYAGEIVDETTIVLDASDGTTTLSWKMTSASTCSLASTLQSGQIMRWNDTVGSSVTATIEFLIDSATTLYTSDVWAEITYLGTSGVPLASIDLDSKFVPLASAVECTTGAGLGSWSGESGSAKSYKFSHTFTPQEVGFLVAKIVIAKASTTIYVNPKLTVS